MKPLKRSASFKGKKTEDVQNQLREFYKNSKEKLLKMKEMKEKSEYELKCEIERKNKLTLDYSETTRDNKIIDLMIKGLNEKILVAKKRKSNLENEINQIKKDMNINNTAIQYMTQQTNFKIQNVENEKQQIASFTKKQIEYLKQEIQKEIKINSDLKKNIENVERQMKDIENELEEINSIEGRKTNALLKETAEMTKFLSQL